jgi:amidase
MTENAAIAVVRTRLATGATSSLALALHALRRIAALDSDGPRLGAVPVIDPAVLRHAAELDAERADGRIRSALHGVPFTVKDSFAVRGLTAAAGSPAFATLVAGADAVVVERLREAGALLIGKTNMPPMAIGGGQAGVYGRTRSPYNPEYLAAAWHSGSSIGSAVAVAAGFCSFGLGEETVSSGRSPASNNALVAYTPSWGVIPSKGNWPLHPYRDVVVPHTRTVADLAEVLAVIAGPDDGDVWADQPSWDRVAATDAAVALRGGLAPVNLDGLVIGVPRLYVGERYGDVEPLPIRPSVLELWTDAERALTAAGATIVHVDFPLVEAYEGRGSAHPTLDESGHLTEGWTAFELDELMTYAWQTFLDAYAVDPPRLAELSPGAIRPDPPFAVDAIENGRIHPGRDVFDLAAILRHPVPSAPDVATVAGPAIAGLDAARRHLFEDWLSVEGIDAIAFPANSDVGAWDAETNPSSARIAWRDGVVFSTTNHVLRRVGIPSVTVPLGMMADTGMPVGLTLAGPAYDDATLIRRAAAIEKVLPTRPLPPLPPVEPLGVERTGHTAAVPPHARVAVAAHAEIQPSGSVRLIATVSLEGTGIRFARIEVGGQWQPVSPGHTTLEFLLDSSRRVLHHETHVVALVTAVGNDGLVAAAAFADIPFLRPDPAIRTTEGTPS